MMSAIQTKKIGTSVFLVLFVACMDGLDDNIHLFVLFSCLSYLANHNNKNNDWLTIGLVMLPCCFWNISHYTNNMVRKPDELNGLFPSWRCNTSFVYNRHQQRSIKYIGVDPHHHSRQHNNTICCFLFLSRKHIQHCKKLDDAQEMMHKKRLF